MRISLISGPGGAIQGWGDMEVTARIKSSLEETGFDVSVGFVHTENELLSFLEENKPEIVWSSLNFISENPEFMGSTDSKVWVSDMLEERNIPYVGSSATTLKTLLDKEKCQQILSNHGLPVPYFNKVDLGEFVPDAKFPVIVKPVNEANSRGISEDSVVFDRESLERQVKYIHDTFQQAAFVEEYLPGREITVPVIGNGPRLILPLEVKINPDYVKKFPLLTHSIKSKGLVKGSVLLEKLFDQDFDKAMYIANQSADLLNCRDSIRVDMREDMYGNLKVIELNGVPGLKPEESYKVWSFYLYNPLASREHNYTMLVNSIVGEAMKRYGMELPLTVEKQMFGYNQNGLQK